MTIVSPSPTPPSRLNTRTLVSTATGRPAAASKGTFAGLRAQAARIAFSAAAPPDAKPKTSSPAATPSTSGPTASTTPAASRPSIAGNWSGMNWLIAPLRIFQSIGFTPAARTAMRICPGPGSGSATSLTCRTSGPPYSPNVTAFMDRSLRLVGQRRHEPVAVADDQAALAELGQRPLDQGERFDPQRVRGGRRPRERGQRRGGGRPDHEVRDQRAPH